MPLSRILKAAILPLALALPATAEVRLSQTDMEKILRKVQTQANDRLEATFLKGSPKSVTGLTKVSADGGGLWRFDALSWGSPGGIMGDEVPVMRLPILIQNHGDRAEVLAYGPEVPLAALDVMEESGKVAKEMKSIPKDRDDCTISFGRKEGRFTMTAVYPYKGDEDDAAERLADLITDARGLSNEILQGLDKALKGARAKLEKAPAKGWSAGDLKILLDDGLEKHEQFKRESDGADYWTFYPSKKEYMEVIHMGPTNLRLGYSLYMGEVSEAETQSAVEKIAAWVKSNPFKGGSVTTIPYPGWSGWPYLWVDLPYDGTLTGEQLRKLYFEFKEEYGPKASKKA